MLRPILIIALQSTLLLGQLTFLITHFQVLDHIAIYLDVPWTIVLHFQSVSNHSASSREEWLEVAHRKKKEYRHLFQPVLNLSVGCAK